MGYFTLLGLHKEPFTTSPDPHFFYLSRGHETALTNILIELRLRRGLSVVFGDIGTGKTTLSRKLVQELKIRPDMTFHMILNPSFESEKEFFITLLRNFHVKLPLLADPDNMSLRELKDAMESFLIDAVVEQKRTVVLIIDEAQKLSYEILESLRLLLNFETNEYKLIQLILLGQMELYQKVVSMSNFLDRISYKFTLNPLGPEEVRALINFRIERAGFKRPTPLFLDEAVSEIYNYSRGYPRRITMLCHQILKELVIQNKGVVTQALVRDVIKKQLQMAWPKQRLVSLTT